jgi:Cu2+-exporting ATPase
MSAHARYSKNRKTASAVFHVGGLHYASEKSVVERVLAKRPGVEAVEANPVAQTATIQYDARQTSIEEPQQWIAPTQSSPSTPAPPCARCSRFRATPARVDDRSREADRVAVVRPLSS